MLAFPELNMTDMLVYDGPEEEENLVKAQTLVDETIVGINSLGKEPEDLAGVKSGLIEKLIGMGFKMILTDLLVIKRNDPEESDVGGEA